MLRLRTISPLSPLFVLIILGFLPYSGWAQVKINDLVISAGENVSLGSSNTITGKIAAGKSLNAESSTYIDGNLYVDGDVILSGGTVTDTVFLSGNLSGNAFSIPGPVSLPALPPFSQEPGSGGVDIITGGDVFPNTSYGSIQLSSNNNTLTFNGPGVYKFQSINITSNNNNFIFDFKNLSGDIIIYVAGNVNFGKSSASLKANGGGAANRILTEIAGNGDLNNDYAFSMDNGKGGKGSKWLGTVLAPNGSILFGSGTGSSNITGALLSGHSVTINSGVETIPAPYQFCFPPVVELTSEEEKDFVCPDDTSVTLVVDASGGTAPFTYEWYGNGNLISSGEGTTTLDVSPTVNTDYHVIVFDSFGNNCSVTSNSLTIVYNDICPGYDPTLKTENIIGSELTSLAQNAGGQINTDIYQIEINSNGDTLVLIDIIVNEGFFIQAGGFIESFFSNENGPILDARVLDVNINNLIYTAFFPIENLIEFNRVAQLSLNEGGNGFINFVRPVYPAVFNQTTENLVYQSVGSITTQGDAAQGSQQAREKFGIYGAGIKIGVLSDSYNTRGDNIGELPKDERKVEVLKEYPYGQASDEGRAMLEIIHEVAPGATLGFRTGFISESDFALGVKEFANSGYDIIVDDITFITEPFFGKGLISHAIDEVTSRTGDDKVYYFTSAGNFGNNGYEDTYNARFVQSIQVKPGSYTIALQWEDDFYSADADGNIVSGAQFDFDIYLGDAAGNILFGFNRNNIGGDPLEILPFKVSSTGDAVPATLIIENANGLVPGIKFKWVAFRTPPGSQGNPSLTIIDNNGNNSTIVGHAANENAITVAAAYHADYATAGVEFFSSRGFVGSTFSKPDITAPDGVSISVGSFLDIRNQDGTQGSDGRPDFFGTSAAAPHAAGVAALILGAQKNLGASSSLSLLDNLKKGALDIGNQIEDGAGFIQADAIFTDLISPLPEIANVAVENGETPGPATVTVFVGGENLTESTQIYVNGVPIENQTVDLTTNTITGDVPPFFGDPGVQLFTLGIDGSQDRLSNSVSFFENKTTILIAVNEDATKFYGTPNPEFITTLTQFEFGNPDPLPVSHQIQSLLLGTSGTVSTGLFSP